jgi:ribonucleotide monophosphatase NagD (HAD superfamily)
MNGSFFIDLDGTILKYQTNHPVEGAVPLVNFLYSEGVQIFFTTRRGAGGRNDPYKDHPILSKSATREALKKIFPKIKYKIIFGVDSPRIVMNDEGCAAGNLTKNEGFNPTQIGSIYAKFEELQQFLESNSED